jgi:glycosyltransferase involved in cell wall biosynthesis
MASLRWLVRHLGLRDSITFTGQVPNDARGAYYRGCRAYLTMSEHEGFCVPIVEAMHVGTPVVAYASTAVPETIGDAGVLVLEKRHDVVGEALALVAADTQLRERLIAKGRERAARYATPLIEARLAELLSDALGRPG